MLYQKGPILNDFVASEFGDSNNVMLGSSNGNTF